MRRPLPFSKTTVATRGAEPRVCVSGPMDAFAGTVGDIGERAIIERIRARLAPPPAWVAVGVGDDAAVLTPERNRAEVITADSLVEGVHFDRAYVPPAAIGHKALAVNLSDLAAMGAEPRAALLSLVLPAHLAVADLDGLLDGFLGLAARYGVALVGGNITRSPGPLVVDVTATGVVKARRVLTRSGARPGDDVYVSGMVGSAAAGLAACRAGCSEGAGALAAPDCVERFLTPDPRVRLGQLIGRCGIVTACMDLSDGLSDALHQVAEASEVGAIVEADAIPVPETARALLRQLAGDGWLEAAVAGGEDYELLFTAPPRRRRSLAAVLRRANGVACTRIGRVTRAREVLLRRPGGDGAFPKGFAHFQ
jgi:thiamine-monophosphate kinase